VTMVWVVSRN